MCIDAYCQAEIARLTAEIAERERMVARLMDEITARRGGIAAYEDVIRELERMKADGLDSSPNLG